MILSILYTSLLMAAVMVFLIKISGNPRDWIKISMILGFALSISAAVITALIIIWQ